MTYPVHILAKAPYAAWFCARCTDGGTTGAVQHFAALRDAAIAHCAETGHAVSIIAGNAEAIVATFDGETITPAEDGGWETRNPARREEREDRKDG